MNNQSWKGADYGDRPKPKFQQRHYEAIADVIRGLQFDKDQEGLEANIIEAFSEMFARDNGNFQRGRFNDAAKGK